MSGPPFENIMIAVAPRAPLKMIPTDEMTPVTIIN